MNKIIALLITIFVIPLLIIILIFSFPYVVHYSYSVYEYLNKDGSLMQQSETKDIIYRSINNLKIYDIKGVKGPSDFHGDRFIKITFYFKNKDIQSLTNKLVDSWSKNKKWRGLTWNKFSKWRISKKTINGNNNKIDLSLPKGSLIYNSKWQWIGIDTNSFKCVYSEFFP